MKLVFTACYDKASVGYQVGKHFCCQHHFKRGWRIVILTWNWIREVCPAVAMTK